MAPRVTTSRACKQRLLRFDNGFARISEATNRRAQGKLLVILSLMLILSPSPMAENHSDSALEMNIRILSITAG